MDKQFTTNTEYAYPDITAERMSIPERQFVDQIKNQWSPLSLNQGFNPNPIPANNTPPQQLKIHTIKSMKAWSTLIKQTLEWVNKNIHPCRIISISIVLCHTTKAGQSTIFYNDAKDDLMKMKIMPYADYALSAAIVESSKSWDNHHKEAMRTAAEVSSSGGVVSISQLQTGFTHDKAMSVIWFLKK